MTPETPPEVCPQCHRTLCKPDGHWPIHTYPASSELCPNSVEGIFDLQKEFDETVADLTAANNRVAELESRLAEIKAGADADETDLAKMRDGTKLTRAGLVQIIVYQQQDIRTLTAERDNSSPPALERNRSHDTNIRI